MYLNYEGTYIRFEQIPAGRPRVTKIWLVVTKHGASLGGDAHRQPLNALRPLGTKSEVHRRVFRPLGEVRWFGGWRKYCFFAADCCVFEEVCMREISDFIVERTKEHKANSKLVGNKAGERRGRADGRGSVAPSLSWSN
jgi:hypothetical protein